MADFYFRVYTKSPFHVVVDAPTLQQAYVAATKANPGLSHSACIATKSVIEKAIRIDTEK